MRPRRRRGAIGLAALAGAVVGVVATLALTQPTASTDAAGTTTSAPPPTTPVTTTPSPPPDADAAAVLLVWTSGGLPPGLAGQVAALDGVRRVTVVRGDQADLLATWDADGAAVDVVPDGWQIPLDVLAVDPATFAPFLEAGSSAVGALRPGEALLTETSARLRRLGPGGTVRLSTGEVTVAGVVDDLSGAGAELIAHTDDAARLGVAADRYLLIQHDGDRAALQQAIADAHPSSTIRFRTPAETTWLRHGDAVVPQAIVKAAYGEFAYRERPGRDIEIAPAWVDRWIVTEPVPILGEVTCHRDLIGDLRAAMDEVAQAGLGHLVDPAAFAGCFSPRRIEAGQPLSRHAWGIAVDLNVDGNPRGSFSTQDARLVEIMRRHGFGWGGTWLVPDPAHYEALPSADAAGASASSDR